MTQWSVAIVIKGQGRGKLRELKRRAPGGQTRK